MAQNRIYKAVCRMKIDANGPLRSKENYQFGFYDPGIVREMLDLVGGDYTMYSLPIPQTQRELRVALKYLEKDEVQYALVDKNKIVFVILSNSPGWMSAMNKLGYRVNSGDKSNKRLKSAHRPTLLNAHFEPDELNIVEVTPERFSRYDFDNEETMPEYYRKNKDRLLDGGFVISTRLIQKAVANLPVYEPDSNEDSQEYYFDPRVKRNLVNYLLKNKAWNVRLIYDKGHLKGNAFAVDDLPEGIDVICESGNIKKEMFYDHGFRFLAEPQPAKTKTLTNEQTMVNLPKLFRKSDMEMWLKEEYKKLFAEVQSGTLLSNWRSIYQRSWKDKESPEENEERARMSYIGYRWTSLGFKVTDSPWMANNTGVRHADPMKKNKVPIPCAVYEQIISESLARMAGQEIIVPEGSIVRSNELQCHVVNDIDYIEMYDSHGGPDQDDFFQLFYRQMEGAGHHVGKKVIAARSPNGYGEYSIFNYIEGEWNPAWHMADGTELRFPKVNNYGWPKRLSEAIFDGEVAYKGLPSSHEPKQHREGPYTKQDVERDIKIAMKGGNVGGFVNACITHSSTIGKHRPDPLCSLEDAIDKCINPDHELDVVSIDAEAKRIMQEVIQSKKPIETSLWATRGTPWYLDKGQEPILEDGTITKTYMKFHELHQKYKKDVFAWTQENCRPPEIIHELGKRMYFVSQNTLREFRRMSYDANSDGFSAMRGSISSSQWSDMYTGVLTAINRMKREEDKHDFVLGLYSASIKVPTSTGTVTDQIVMNNQVFPYLERALQFYGLANIVTYHVESTGKVTIRSFKNNQWWYPNAEGELIKYTDPLEFQKAHMKDSPITGSI